MIPAVEREIGPGILPKKMFMTVAEDSEVPLIVRTIMQINRIEHHGEGRIFVRPIFDAIRIQIGKRETGALQ